MLISSSYFEQSACIRCIVSRSDSLASTSVLLLLFGRRDSANRKGGLVGMDAEVDRLARLLIKPADSRYSFVCSNSGAADIQKANTYGNTT